MAAKRMTPYTYATLMQLTTDTTAKLLASVGSERVSQFSNLVTLADTLANQRPPRNTPETVVSHAMNALSEARLAIACGICGELRPKDWHERESDHAAQYQAADEA